MGSTLVPLHPRPRRVALPLPERATSQWTFFLLGENGILVLWLIGLGPTYAVVAPKAKRSTEAVPCAINGLHTIRDI